MSEKFTTRDRRKWNSEQWAKARDVLRLYTRSPYPVFFLLFFSLYLCTLSWTSFALVRSVTESSPAYFTRFRSFFTLRLLIFIYYSMGNAGRCSLIDGTGPRGMVFAIATRGKRGARDCGYRSDESKSGEKSRPLLCTLVGTLGKSNPLFLSSLCFTNHSTPYL